MFEVDAGKVFAFAGNRTAKIEVLLNAVAFLIVRDLQLLYRAAREIVLRTFEETVGELVPGPNPPPAGEAWFFEGALLNDQAAGSTAD